MTSSRPSRSRLRAKLPAVRASRSPGGSGPAGRRRGPARALLVASGLVVAVLVASQIALPAIAEHQVRSALGPQATGVHVRIEAVPAIKLLWHRADRVTVDVDRLRPHGSGGWSVGEMFSHLRVAPNLDLRVRDLSTHGVELHGVSLHKEGDVVVGHADVDVRRLEASLPFGLRIRPLTASDDAIRLEGSFAPMGGKIGARASLVADRGRIVVRPEGIPLASLVTIPVFSDDRIAIDHLAGRPTADGIALTARAHLRA
jgi:hypothetical protein